MPLIELLYSSYTAIGKEVNIAELVDQAAHKNKLSGITGCLLASDSEFFPSIGRRQSRGNGLV